VVGARLQRSSLFRTIENQYNWWNYCVFEWRKIHLQQGLLPNMWQLRLSWEQLLKIKTPKEVKYYHENWVSIDTINTSKIQFWTVMALSILSILWYWLQEADLLFWNAQLHLRTFYYSKKKMLTDLKNY
jgi:hypothetical protein